MVFKQGSKYYLKGIVSVSIALQSRLTCDTNSYAVFTDASKFTNWVKEHM